MKGQYRKENKILIDTDTDIYIKTDVDMDGMKKKEME
jgi:hypothetical protein